MKSLPERVGSTLAHIQHLLWRGMATYGVPPADPPFPLRSRFRQAEPAFATSY